MEQIDWHRIDTRHIFLLMQMWLLIVEESMISRRTLLYNLDVEAGGGGGVKGRVVLEAGGEGDKEWSQRSHKPTALKTALDYRWQTNQVALGWK